MRPHMLVLTRPMRPMRPCSAAPYACGSAYSLVSVSRAALPHLLRGENAGGSITALSYIGAERAVSNYNVMGPAKASLEACARGLALELGPHAVRVNCLSPGPMNTLAARGLRGFGEIASQARARAPLGRSTEHAELAASATFLASDGAAAITGQTLRVDAGFSSVAI